MRYRLLIASFAALSIAAPAAGRRTAAAPDPGAIAAKHLSRLRMVFREAYAPEVLLSAIVYSAASDKPEHMVALRRSRNSYQIIALEPAQAIWRYGMVEMFRSRAWAIGTVKKGRGIVDHSDEEADRVASTLPADPRHLRLSRCAVPVEPRLAARIIATWQRLFLRAPDEKPTGVAGIMETYLLRTGKDEREVDRSEWAPRDRPAPRLIELVDSMNRSCRRGRAQGDDIQEALSDQR